MPYDERKCLSEYVLWEINSIMFSKQCKIKLSEIQEIPPKWLDLTQKTNICQNNLTYLIFNTYSKKN